MEAKIYKTASGSIQTNFFEKDPFVAITQQFVTLDANGLAVDATATSASIAFVVAGGELGSTSVQVVADPFVVYSIDSDADVADTDRNKEVDLVVVGGVIVADIGASTTDVLKTLGSADFQLGTRRLLVTINKPIMA